jgi:hypothetical protein
MLLRDMKKRIRFLIGGFVLLFSLMAVGARAQSAFQSIGFSVLGEYETVTNGATADPPFTNLNFHLILITSINVAKAIAVDKFGHPGWTNWAGALLLRRVNLVTGEERIYLDNTNEQVDVSDYFTNTYLSNFSADVGAAFPAATNNFTTNNPNPLEPIYSGGSNNHRAVAGLHFISLNTTNLKMNLVGASFGGLGLGIGVLNKFSGEVHGTNYDGEVPNDVMQVVGTFTWTPDTNIFDIRASTNAFYSGPAHGTVTTRLPYFSPKALPP